jgi:uncharacterized protein (TIGR01777 family)
MSKRILITGGSGFVGHQLVPSLIEDGYEITILTRNVEKAQKTFAGQNITFISSLSQLDLGIKQHFIINLAGEPIADKNWSKQQKDILIKSRTKTTKDVVDYIEHAKFKPDLLISASAIGFYGFHDRRVFSERSTSIRCFASYLCKKWEKATVPAKKHTRVAIIRLGVVLGRDGGMLKKLLPSFKLGLGAVIGDGKQHMSWIHIADVVEIIKYLITQHDSQGIYNLTAPVAVTNKEFSQTFAKALNRPCFLKLPSCFVKTIFGQMGEELLLGSQNIMPQKLLSLGYEFKYPHLNQAMKDIFKD